MNIILLKIAKQYRFSSDFKGSLFWQSACKNSSKHIMSRCHGTSTICLNFNHQRKCTQIKKKTIYLMLFWQINVDNIIIHCLKFFISLYSINEVCRGIFTHGIWMHLIFVKNLRLEITFKVLKVTIYNAYRPIGDPTQERLRSISVCR